MKWFASLLAITICTIPASLANETKDRSTCLRESQISSFSSIDKQHVLLTSGSNDQWLVTLKHSCRGLPRDQIIAIDGDGFGCLNSFDRVLVQNGSVPQSCPIDTVEPIESREMARAAIAERRQGPRFDLAAAEQ